MRTLALAVIFILTISVGFCQVPSAVRLKWKIPEGDAIQYSTIMDEVESSPIEPNLSRIFGRLGDSLKRDSSALQIFRDLQQESSKQHYITTLSRGKPGIVEIVMSATNDSTANLIKDKKGYGNGQSLTELMKAMNEGIMLRGSV